MPCSSPRFQIIPPFPESSLPSPWGITFALLSQPQTCLFRLSPAMQLRLDMEVADRRLVLYWIAKKKWLPKLKIPADRKYSQLLQPWGELLFRTLELVIAWHSLPSASSSPYRDSAHCYLEVIQEVQRLDLNKILANEPTGKTRFIKDRYAITSKLKNQENPANQTLSPHFFNLMQAALELEKQDQFNRQYWQPFLHACNTWKQALEEKQCKEIYVEADRILFQNGRGRSKLRLVDLASL